MNVLLHSMALFVKVYAWICNNMLIAEAVLTLYLISLIYMQCETTYITLNICVFRSHMKCGTYMCLMGLKPPLPPEDPKCVLESLSGT